MWLRAESGNLFNLTDLQRIEVIEVRYGHRNWVVRGILCCGNSVEEVEIFKHRSREEVEQVRDQIADCLATADQLLDIRRSGQDMSHAPIAASTT